MTPLKASQQANVARLRNQAAMVNESTRSTHHEFTPVVAEHRHKSYSPPAAATPDEEKQKSSLSLTTP
jgi:hypothetical protein